MGKKSGFIQTKRIQIMTAIVFLAALIAATPALAEYLGPNRTVTETHSSCKVILNECMYVPSKGDYRYHQVDEWSCSNESKPWQAYPSQPPRACYEGATGDKYWEREETSYQVITTYPPATISGTLQNCTLHNGWCTSTPQLSLIGNEPVAGYSIVAIEGTRNGQGFACSGASCSVSLLEGNNSFNYWAFSSFTDTSLMGSLNAKVDSIKPVITGTLSGTAGTNGWYTSPITFNNSASDATSGLAAFNCTLDGVAIGSCSSILIEGQGPHTINLTARDNAGHTQLLAQNVSIDTQNPLLDASLSGTLGSNNWYNAAVLNGAASDPLPGSDLFTFEFSLDDNSWSPFPSSGILSLPEGRHTVSLRATDRAGNTVYSSKSISLDSSLPVITLDPVGTAGLKDWYTGGLSLSASASDAISGLDIFEYNLDESSWNPYTDPLVLEDGIHTVRFWAQDQSGLVTQVDGTFKVDTRPPQIAGTLSGTEGENGWFTSQVSVSVSASDPLPGSGMETLTYILDDEQQATFSEALTLADGQHTLLFTAQDKAGLSHSMEAVIKVDTLPPALMIGTTLPAWVRDTIPLDGTADDGGSGLSNVEISTNGGQTWQTLENDPSWSYLWNTIDSSNGMHEVLVRASDNAGHITQQRQKVGVDHQGPQTSMPASWLQWNTVTIDVSDEHSGLSEAHIEISDSQGRWPARILPLDPAQFPMQFTWDRRFGDDVIAPAGTYDIKVIASDNLENTTTTVGTIKVILNILPPGPTATPLPPSRPQPTPTASLIPTSIPTITATPAVVVRIFGNTLEPEISATPTTWTAPTPRATPSQTSVLEWLETIFQLDAGSMESTIQISSLGESETSSAPEESGVLWGAAAAAMMGAVTSYTLEEKRRQEEEKARQLAEEREEEERREKKQAQKLEKLEAQWAQERLWEQARLEEELLKDARSQARMDEQLLHRGPEADEGAKWAESQRDLWLRANEKKLAQEAFQDRRAQMSLLRNEAEEGDKWFAAQAEIRKKYEDQKAEELQAGLAAYYNARKQGEQEAPQPEPNYWETTKSFLNEHLVQPFNANVYQPIIKPVLDWREKAVEFRNQLIDEYIYQPVVKPAVQFMRQGSEVISTWIDQKIYQPGVKPLLDGTGKALGDVFNWINEKVVQPHIKPALEKTVQFIQSEAAWLDENIYQPFIQPVIKTVEENIYQPFIKPQIEWRVELLKKGVSWLNENVYQPMYAPMFEDIYKHIYQPFAKEVKDWWGDYGEWVHGALDVVGLVPGLGEIADGVNGLIYLAEGRKLEATLSFISAVPLVGYVGATGKVALKVGQNIVDAAVKPVAKGLFGEAIEKASKESIEQVAETTVKQPGEWIHSALDVMGCIPGAGEFSTSLNGLIQLGKGRFADATFSAISMVPVVGDVVTTGKKIIDSSLERIIKEAAEELREKAVKEGGEELLERTSVNTADEAADTTLHIIQKELKEDAFIERITEDDSPEASVSPVQSVVVEQSLETTHKQFDKETAQYVLKEVEEGKVTKLPQDVAE